MSANELFDPARLKKYNINGPRYTSYPTALTFSGLSEPAPLEKALSVTQASGVSLYVHIPFCHSLCYYCGCNKIVTRHQEKADRYLDYLEKEIQRRAPAFRHRKVEQIHLGGGTPGFLTEQQQTRLAGMLKSAFDVVSDAEMSIEIDPRRTTPAYLRHLASLGYNRLSIGVQDTDYRVQEAINRVQSTSHIATLVDCARSAGFKSVNLDLIYGLPHQTADTFASTLAAVKAMAPERISLFSYAHLPERFAAQRKIKDEWLPSAQVKTGLMKQAITSLTQAGYEMIGMDHFALPSDELAEAQRNKKLHRNFQGYTTRGDLDLLGLGVSSISAAGNAYLQNPKTLNDYYGKLDSNEEVAEKGVFLSPSDLLRRYVIQQLMCNLAVDFAATEALFGIQFRHHFEPELAALKEFEEDGLLQVTGTGIEVFPSARLFIRIICMTFDAYLKGSAAIQHRYSRVI